MKVSRFIGTSVLLGHVLGAPTLISSREPRCEHISYAQFDGKVCGVIVFRHWSDRTVSVEHVGDGLCGLEDGQSYPYHSIIPPPSSIIFPERVVVNPANGKFMRMRYAMEIVLLVATALIPSRSATRFAMLRNHTIVKYISPL